MPDKAPSPPPREPEEASDREIPVTWGSWDSTPEPGGDILDGRYRLEDEIGSGASSITYRGLDQRLGRRVAIKILREQYTLEPMFMRRFEREARAAASVSHPNVVNVHDFGQHGNRPYIVMDFVDGENLKERLARAGPLPPADAIRLARQVLAGLVAIHHAGIIHRDIKPQNILIGRDETARLADFGIAHLSADAGLTTTGTTLGTASYMAPEQAQGGPLVPATDLYAVGVVLYEMLTGRLPFEAPSAVAVLYAHLHAQPVPPSQRVSGLAIAPALDHVVMRAMAKRPADRFADAAEMRDELGAVAVHAGPSDERDTRPMEAATDPSIAAWPGWRSAASTGSTSRHHVEGASRHRGDARVLAWTLGLLALLLVGGGATGAWLLTQDPGGDGADTNEAAYVGAGTATAAAQRLGTPPDQAERLAVAPGDSSNTATDTPEPNPTRPPVPSATPPPEPTATPTLVPTAPPPPTSTPIPTSPPTSTPVPTPTPTEAVELVPAGPEPEGDAAAGASEGGDGAVIVDHQGETQVIEPVDGDVPAGGDDAAESTQPAEVTFTAQDWHGAYFQATGNLQPWAALYAQSTGYGQGTVAFSLPGQPVTDTFTLTVEGMTSESWGAVPIEIRVNGQVVYADTSPFPMWNGVDGQQPWTTVRFELPAVLLRPGENTVTFVNMVGEGGFSLPPYILLASGSLTVEILGAD